MILTAACIILVDVFRVIFLMPFNNFLNENEKCKYFFFFLQPRIVSSVEQAIFMPIKAYIVLCVFQLMLAFLAKHMMLIQLNGKHGTIVNRLMWYCNSKLAMRYGQIDVKYNGNNCFLVIWSARVMVFECSN